MSKLLRKEDIIKALDTVYKAQMTSGSVRYKNLFFASPQYKDTGSEWARIILNGYAKPWEIAWAISLNGEENLWLAARIQLGNKAYYFNLRSYKDRKRLEDVKTALSIGGIPGWAI